MKRFLKADSLLVIGVFLAGLIGVAQSIQAATELARINATVISLEDFNRKYQENLKFFQFKSPSKKSVLDDLIKRELGIQEARKLGLDKDPAVIDQMNTVLYHALIDRKLGKEFEAIHVEDAEARAYYEKNPEVRTSHIFVAVAPSAAPQDERKAFEKIKKIYDEHIKSGKESFAEVAQTYSEGMAAQMGGDIDFQTKDKLDPNYYDAAIKLKSAGRVSGIVRTQFGYHIIKLTALRSWEETDRPLIKRLVFEERRNQIFERFMGQLKGQAKVTVHNELLKD